MGCEAAREKLTLIAPRTDAASGRPRLPSRVLMRLASLASGKPVGLDDFLTGAPLAPVWRHVGGAVEYADGRGTVWVDAAERDTAALLALSGSGGSAGAQPYLAAVLGDEAAARRRSGLWRTARDPSPGAWDGLLGADARAALAARHPFDAEMHPTRLERYVSCPFAFLLRHVYGLEAPDEPGESLEMEPREFGTLAHDILQRAFDQLIAAWPEAGAVRTRPPPGPRSTRRGRPAAPRAEALGVTGAPLAWTVTRAMLREDLLETVRRDPVFAAEVARSRWSGASARPPGRPVALELPGGRSVRFAGRVDRVDVTAAGARVIDYKTGKGTSERERLKAGLSVQLPVYQLAVRQAGAAGHLEVDRRGEIESLYLLVTRKGGFEPLPLPENEPDAAARLARLVAGAVALVDAGMFPRTTAGRCEYCDVGYACGTSAWSRARKRGHEAAERRRAPSGAAGRRGTTMTPEREVVDQDVRDRVTSDLGTTFLLEAGAGTGKTRVLVDRYVRCVLDPERGSGDVRTVAAITFTEKAAGELRQRVREEFESRAAGAAVDSAEAEAIARALDALDDAPIGTIHGFAGRLLREFPVEAGVDPAFEQLDGLGSELERARLWEEWLAELAGADVEAPADAEAAGAGLAARRLSRLLRAGVRLDKVQELAIGAKGVFGERYDLDTAPEPADEPELGAALAGLGEPLARLREYCRAACVDRSDKGFAAAMDLAEAVERLLAAPPADVDRPRGGALRPAGEGEQDRPRRRHEGLGRRPRRQGGTAGPLQGACGRHLRRRGIATRSSSPAWPSPWPIPSRDGPGRRSWPSAASISPTSWAACATSSSATGIARPAPRCRRASATSSSTSSRTPTRCRPRSPSSSASASRDAADWREVVLEPGKLFVVGDPKQSIYRFRRADISLYDQVKRAVAGQPAGAGAVLAISQNFRTTPAVVGWVNNVFAGVFDHDQEEGRQPGYQWVEPYRPAAEGARIAVLLGREYGGAAGESDAARRDEARALAALLVEMHGPDAARWRVQDRDPPRPARTASSRPSKARARPGAGAEPLRDPRWGDVALLFRATTGLETYEQALREAGVPYRVEGGKSYFERREVADALLCLRAADDPSDGPALYGALHSSFFGFSDDDLFLFWAAGGRFDLYAAERQPAGYGGIVAALATLRGLHERRTECEPYELAAELVRLAHAARVPRGDRRAAQRRRSPISRSWWSGRVRSPAPAGAASARSSPGPPRPATPQGSRSRRSTTRATSSTSSRSTRPRASSTPSSYWSAVRWRAAEVGGADRGPLRATPRDQAQGGAARSGGARPRAAGVHGAEHAREGDVGQRVAAPALRGDDQSTGPTGAVVLRQAEQEGRRPDQRAAGAGGRGAAGSAAGRTDRGVRRRRHARAAAARTRGAGRARGDAGRPEDDRGAR